MSPSRESGGAVVLADAVLLSIVEEACEHQVRKMLANCRAVCRVLQAWNDRDTVTLSHKG